MPTTFSSPSGGGSSSHRPSVVLSAGVFQRDLHAPAVKMPIARQPDDEDDEDDAQEDGIETIMQPQARGSNTYTIASNRVMPTSAAPAAAGSSISGRISGRVEPAAGGIAPPAPGHAAKKSIGGWTNNPVPGTISSSSSSTAASFSSLAHPLPSPSVVQVSAIHPLSVESSTSPSHADSALPSSAHQPHGGKKPALSEFAREMEHKFGKPRHGFAKLSVQRKPFFDSPNLAHLLHRPQLKQYYRWKNNVLVRQNHERKPRWDELFFDLVFICVFHRVAHDVHNAEVLDGRALTEFAVLFAAAWKIWFDLTVYVNQFDPTDMLHKVYFLTQMIFVMGLAVMSIKGVIGSYLAGTGVTLLLRCWSAYYCPRARQDAYVQSAIWVVAAIPWLASLAVHSTSNDAAHATARADYAQFELWGAGLVIAYGGQFLAQLHPRFHIPLNIEHITERFGIFTILCMGEQVVNVMFQDTTASRESFMMAVLGGIMIFAVQILYYDVDGFNHKMHALRGTRFRGYLWAVLHCPFHALIIISSVTFNFFVDSTMHLHEITERVTFHAEFAAAVAGTYTGTAVEAFQLGQEAMEAAVLAAEHGTEHLQVIDTTHRQLFCIANGGMVAVLFLIALLHVPREGHLIRRRWRMIGRAIGTLAFLLLHLFGTDIPPVGMMAYGGFCLGLIAVADIYGNFIPHTKKKGHPYAVNTAHAADQQHVIAIAGGSMAGDEKTSASPGPRSPVNGGASSRSTIGGGATTTTITVTGGNTTHRSDVDDESAFTPDHSDDEAEMEPSVMSRVW